MLRKSSVCWVLARLPRAHLWAPPMRTVPRPPRHPWAEVCSGQCLDKLSKTLHLPPSGPCVLQAQLGPTAFMPNLWRLPPQRRLHHNLRCEQRVSSQCAGTSLLAPSGWWIPHHSGVRSGAGGAAAASCTITLHTQSKATFPAGHEGGRPPITCVAH